MKYIYILLVAILLGLAIVYLSSLYRGVAVIQFLVLLFALVGGIFRKPLR